MKAWQEQEKRVAKRRNGKQNPGSGSGWRKPNDVREEKVLWEMKQTGAKQITIKLADWDKVRSNAIFQGRMPAMHLQLGEGRSARRLVVLSEDDFDTLMPVSDEGRAQLIVYAGIPHEFRPRLGEPEHCECGLPQAAKVHDS